MAEPNFSAPFFILWSIGKGENLCLTHDKRTAVQMCNNCNGGCPGLLNLLFGRSNNGCGCNSCNRGCGCNGGTRGGNNGCGCYDAYYAAQYALNSACGCNNNCNSCGCNSCGNGAASANAFNNGSYGFIAASCGCNFYGSNGGCNSGCGCNNNCGCNG